MSDHVFTFIDLETTGTSTYKDRVIEVGLVRVENGREVLRYQSLVNPEVALPGWIERLTGIRAESLYDAPLFSDLAQKIQELTAGSIMVAHNAGFDYSFLKREMYRARTQWESSAVCSVRYSRNLYPGFVSHSLDAVSKRHNLRCKHRHRALDDADLIWQFFQLVEKEFPQDKLSQALERSYIHTGV